ncbi:MAG TPA: pyridoxamine 5'-phosphate oxidase [Blastocatellia bacterium]|jgi:pyridoxamine 5'-phosphate oxidase|nr:pyridoxamine 5'-phosphate oxidase [Blastocatellia bacterium]
MPESNREDELTGLIESNVDPNPFKQFRIWFEQAEAAGSKLSNAMTLATATAGGVPSVRMVLLKDFDERGFVFYTNYESQKGKELQENPVAALNFYWSVLDRQVRITGRTTKTSREESEEYFHTRPVDSQLGAWASRQSQVIDSRETLEERMRQLMSEYDGKQIPLPPYWGGFRLSPTSIEFWQNRASRLHDRLRYTRRGDDDWLIERLSP